MGLPVQGADKGDTTNSDVWEGALCTGMVRVIANLACEWLGSHPGGLEIEEQGAEGDCSMGVGPGVGPGPVHGGGIQAKRPAVLTVRGALPDTQDSPTKEMPLGLELQLPFLELGKGRAPVVDGTLD